MTNKQLDKAYICVGENWNGYVKLGFCGEVHSLGNWLDILFPNEDARKYFDKDTPGTVLEYIKVHRGKRLEKV